MRHIYTLLLFVLLTTHVLGQGKAKRNPVAPTPDLKYVQDNAGWLKPAEIDSLRSQFARYEKGNGVWFSVWTEPQLTGKDVNYTNYQHYNARKVLHKDSARGVVLSFFSKERKMAISVGINLEDKLTHKQRKHIMDDVMRPLLKAGNNYGAIAEGVAEAQRILAGMPAPETESVSTSIEHRDWLDWFMNWRWAPYVFFGGLLVNMIAGGYVFSKLKRAEGNGIQWLLLNLLMMGMFLVPLAGAAVMYGTGRMLTPRRGSGSGGGSYSSSNDDDSDDSSSDDDDDSSSSSYSSSSDSSSSSSSDYSSSGSDYSSSGSDYSSSDSSGSSSDW